MYVDRSQVTVRGKTYQRVLLRQSYRQEGKVKHRTVANLSACSPEEIQAIELAFRHKKNLPALQSTLEGPLHLRQGLSLGSVWLLHCLAQSLGLTRALGTDRAGKLALWQVLARVIDQGSRLSAVRLARSHAACDVVGLDSFNEDDLYANLGWLAQNQAQIEETLFHQLHPEGCPDIFLYDVTSSYLEGEQNALAAWGYSRDGKAGKKQIVIGLLCDAQGRALSIEVFAGNTQDPHTLGAQIQKAVEPFGAKAVTFVGDRGMIKGPQIAQLGQKNFHYITAITKPQIESLMNKGVLQLELFDEALAEVVSQAEGVRYIMRRNPHRAGEMEQTRRSKRAALEQLAGQLNDYLAAHPRAQVGKAERKLRARAVKLKIDRWVLIQTQERQLVMKVDAEALSRESRLDGCYVIKTDLPVSRASAQMVHDRYKDLALVEQNFRTCKTVQLEVRPVYVRMEASTRGHVFVVMLAYRLVQKLQQLWASEDITVEEGIGQLSSLCVTEVVVSGQVKDQLVPEGRAQVKKLLELAQVMLPRRLRHRGVVVSTKKKLAESRPRRLK